MTRVSAPRSAIRSPRVAWLGGLLVLLLGIVAADRLLRSGAPDESAQASPAKAPAPGSLAPVELALDSEPERAPLSPVAAQFDGEHVPIRGVVRALRPWGGLRATGRSTIHLATCALADGLARVVETRRLGETDDAGTFHFLLPRASTLGRGRERPEHLVLFAAGTESIGASAPVTLGASSQDDIVVLTRAPGSLELTLVEPSGAVVSSARVRCIPCFQPWGEQASTESVEARLDALGSLATLFERTADARGQALFAHLPLTARAGEADGRPARAEPSEYDVALAIPGRQTRVCERIALRPDDRTVLTLTVRLDDTPTIRGSVVDTWGHAIERARVVCEGADPSATVTDAHGAYALDLALWSGGDIRVLAHARGYLPSVVRIAASAVSPLVAPTHVLRTPASLELHVLDEHGRSVAGAIVDLVPSAELLGSTTSVPALDPALGKLLEGTAPAELEHECLRESLHAVRLQERTDATGRVRFECVAEGPWIAALRPLGPLAHALLPSPTTVLPGQDQALVVTLPNERAASLSLSLVDPTTRASVAAAAGAASYLGAPSGTEPPHLLATVEGERLVWEGLLEGTWRVWACAPPWATVCVDVTVAGSEHRAETIELQSAGSVRGTVSAEAGHESIDLSALAISASRPAHCVAPFSARQQGSRDRYITGVGADGTFVLRDLTPGAVDLVVRGEGVHGARSITLPAGLEAQVELRVRRVRELVLLGDLTRCDGTATVLLASPTGDDWSEEAVVSLPQASPWGRVNMPPGCTRWRVRLECTAASHASTSAEQVSEGALDTEELALELAYTTVEHRR